MTILATLQAFVVNRDHRVMRRVHRWQAPTWIRVWMICATRGGDGWFWYSLGFVLLLFGGPHRFAATGSAGVAAAVGIGVFLAMKRLSRRRRPSKLERHAWANLLPPDQFSFPSGHTITAFAVAVPLGLFYPSLMAALLFCALSIAISRIVLGMHFLSDVLAGAAIGAGLGTLSYLAFV